jgi:hypothetical protein
LSPRGHVVCYAHGGRSPQAIRSAKVRAAVAEVLAADPRRSPREVLGDALHIADLVLRDRIAELRDMSEITAEAAADLTDAATRAAALARAAMDAGVDVEAEVPGEVDDQSITKPTTWCRPGRRAPSPADSAATRG